MSALVGAGVRATAFHAGGGGELPKSEHTDGVVVAVSGESVARGPLGPVWHCLLLVDGPDGEGALMVVESDKLAILSCPALTPNVTREGADEALAKAEATVKQLQLRNQHLDSECALQAAQINELKKALKKASKGESGPGSLGGE